MIYNIELKNIQKKYGDRIIINNGNFNFDNKHIYIISGKNGCGKSTLLNIISNYDTDYKGSYNKHKLKVAYLLQEDMLFRNLTVKENLKLKIYALYLTNNDEIITYISDKLNLHDILEKKIYELSGGEKKKVGIGQILISDSDIILLDEPISNIQEDYAKELMDIIFDVFRDKILIITSHKDICSKTNRPFIKIEIKEGDVKYEV